LQVLLQALQIVCPANIAISLLGPGEVPLPYTFIITVSFEGSRDFYFIFLERRCAPALAKYITIVIKKPPKG
jgi:hypothetical protein